MDKFGKMQYSCLAKFGNFTVVEIEHQFTCQALCIGNFLFGAKSLVKSTLDVHVHVDAFFTLQTFKGK